MAQSIVSDSELAEACCSGDVRAFEGIVERYKGLVCSITYSATGNLAASEELAQETFLTAWRRLASLQDRTRLRAWLCGIARNMVRSRRRKDDREPAAHAEPLDAAWDISSSEPSPAERAIGGEEEAVLWRALERLPATYREPMVLYYREECSVRDAAEMLDLSEDAVKQRLSRGRALLRAEVAAYVAQALRRSRPKKTFTAAVVAAISAGTSKSASAGTGSATAAAAQGLAGGAVGGVLGSAIGLAGGVLGVWSDYQRAQTREEKTLVLKMGGTVFAYVAFFGFLLAMLPHLTRVWGVDLWDLLGGWGGFFVGGICVLICWYNKRLSCLRLRARGIDPTNYEVPVLVQEDWCQRDRQMSGESPRNAAARIAAAFILFGGFLATWILVQYRILNVSRGLLWLGGLSAVAGLVVWRVVTSPMYMRRARRSVAMVTGALFLYIGAWLALNSLVKPLLGWSPSVQAVLEGLYLIGLSGLILWSVLGARGLEKRGQFHTQSDTAPASPAKPIHLSRQATIVNNYLMFGGAVCWMGILAAMCGDWGTVALISVSVLAVPWLTLRAFAPRYWRVTLFNVLGAAALSLLVVNVRWHAWMEVYTRTRFYEAANDLPLWVMDVLLLVLFAAIAGGCALKDRRPRASLRNQPGKGGEQ